MITLPKEILNSKWLNAYHLQMLSTVDSIPDINPGFDDENLKAIFQYYSLSTSMLEDEVHKYAAKLLDTHKINEAWQVLLSV